MMKVQLSLNVGSFITSYNSTTIISRCFAQTEVINANNQLVRPQERFGSEPRNGVVLN